MEFREEGAAHDRVAHVAACDPVLDVLLREQGRRRTRHRAELHEREQRLPERDLVPEHDQHAVASPNASLRRKFAT